MQPDVSIIVVSWNSRDTTLACLDSICRETTATTYEIIVVDNNSTDGSTDAITRQAPDVTILPQNENLGFARACNLGAASARGRYILFLNPQTRVRGKAIDRLVGFARCTPDARIWGGRTLNADGSLAAASCAADMTPWNQICGLLGLAQAFPNSQLFNGEAYGGWQRDSVRFVDVVSSTFLLIEAGLWRALGGFDVALYMYGEDADLCLRARKLGAAPCITPDAEIVHSSGAARQSEAGRLTKQLAAKATLVRKHWPVATRWLGAAILRALPITRSLATGLAARFYPNGTCAERHRIWKQVLEDRKAWMNGYRTRPAGQPWPVEVAATAQQTMAQTRPATLKAG